MRGALVAALVVAAAGCGDLFKTFAPEGYTCSPTGTCPAGQQCVPSEHVCRTPCTQTNMAGGPVGSTPNSQCQIQQNIDNSQMAVDYACDYDHFCRRSCFSGDPCSGCSATEACDTTVNVCRPSCSTACPTSWGCVAQTSPNNVMPPMMCNVCRPLATSTFVVPTFAPQVTYDSGTAVNTYSIAVGDLTGNGRPSVIALDQFSKKIYVYLNNGDGTLTPSLAYTTGVGMPWRAAVVDITHDGKADVVVAAIPQPVVLAGNGDGTFAPLTLGPTIPTTDLVAGDFDNDGKPDVAFCGSGTRQLNLTSADGAGGLKVLATYNDMNNAASYVRLGAADFNGDHKLDLYTDDPSLGYSIFVNPGGSTFSFTPGNSNGGSGGSTRFDAVAFDATGDGTPDVVAILGSAPIGMNSTSWYFQIAAYNSGGFNINTNADMQRGLPGASAIAAGDFDGDGHIDAAVADAESAGKNAVHILSGDGTTLTWSASIPASGGPNSIAVADLDGDGKPDIVVGLGNGVAVFMNTTPSH